MCSTMPWNGPYHGRHFDTTGEAASNVLRTSLHIRNKFADSHGRRMAVCSPQGATTTFATFLKLRRSPMRKKKLSVPRQFKGSGPLSESRCLLQILISGGLWKRQRGRLASLAACHRRHYLVSRRQVYDRYQAHSPTQATIPQLLARSTTVSLVCNQPLPSPASSTSARTHASGTSTALSLSVSSLDTLHLYLPTSTRRQTCSAIPYPILRASHAPLMTAKLNIGGNTRQRSKPSPFAHGATVLSQLVVALTISASTSTTAHQE